MAAYQKGLRPSTRGNCQVIEIHRQVEQIVRESGIRTGIANVSARGSTVGLTTLEYEPGCIAGLRRALDQIAPPTSDYAHN